MLNKSVLSVLFISLICVMPRVASAHCEIPCGIYDDEAKIHELNQHIDTIEKSMNEILTLEASDTPNMNQLVRWINNKDEHANKIKTEVATYFLSQRVKFPKDDSEKENYFKQLELIHQISVYAMKTKQTTDLENVNILRKSLKDYSDLIESMHGHAH